MTTSESLTDRQLAILRFEREWWRYAGAKDYAIRVQFNVQPAAYYAELDNLIQTDTAEAHDRLLVVRLRRLARQRARAREAREGRTP